MNNGFAVPSIALAERFRLGLLTLSLLALAGCGQPASDSAGSAADPADAPVAQTATEKAADSATGFVSDAPIKAAEQAMDSLQKQKLLQSSQASDAVVPRPELTQQEQHDRLKAAAAKTDELLQQSADQAASTSQSP